MNYLNSQDINIKEIVRNLYDFSQSGVISIQNVLTPRALKDLQKAAHLNTHLFREVLYNEGTAEQQMSTLYFDKVPQEAIALESLPILSQLRLEYHPIYQSLAKEAQFKEDDFNKMGFHRYQAGSLGITTHQDYERHINLISIFNIAGNTPFYYCKDEHAIHACEIDSSPGSLILLRAARDESEQRYRPFHSVGKVNAMRLSLNIRTRRYPYP